MHYDPRKDARPLPYDPFKSCTVPRPIGWISTVSRDGKPCHKHMSRVYIRNPGLRARAKSS